VRSLNSTKRSTELAAVAQSGGRGPSRYTRSVAWRHRIAVVLVLALTGLPVSGTLCAIACESASMQTAAHHGKDATCEEPASPSSGHQVGDQSAHDCSTHAAIRHVATTAPERVDPSAKSAPSIIGSPSIDEFVVLHEAKGAYDYAVPPGTAPPTARPLVLRV
jgi:hypothetical protein